MTKALSKQKAKIADNFNNASALYDTHARVQKIIALKLAKYTLLYDLPEKIDVLEIGCGTGLLSQALVITHEKAKFWLTDISPFMLEVCEKKLKGFNAQTHFAVMDGENIQTKRKFDLIISSLTFQWFEDFEASINKLKGHLKPGGYLMFATMGENSFKRWRSINNEYGLAQNWYNYPSLEKLKTMLPDAIELAEENIDQSYPTALDMLKNMKKIGSGTPPKNHKPLSPAVLRDIFRKQRDFSDNYHVLFGVYQAPTA